MMLNIFKKVVLSTIVIASTSVFADCGRDLSAGWEDWQPYQYKDGGNLTGLDIELLNLISSEMGCSFSYKELPWKRHLSQLKAGKVDLAAGASVTPEREEFAHFSHAYREEVMALYVNVDSKAKYNINTVSDLLGTDFKLGVERGYFYGNEMKKVLEDKSFKANVQEVAGFDKNVGKATKGRIDGFVGDPAVIHDYLKKNGLTDKIIKLPVKVNADNVHIMLSKKSGNNDLLTKLNAAIDKVKASSVYKGVIEKYLGK